MEEGISASGCSITKRQAPLAEKCHRHIGVSIAKNIHSENDEAFRANTEEMSGTRKHDKSTSKAETEHRQLSLTQKHFARGERRGLGI